MLRLKPGDLKAGLPLAFDTYDEVGQLLLRCGFVIDNEVQVTRLLERGIYRDATATLVAQPTTPALAPARRLSALGWLALVQQVLDELVQVPDAVRFVPRVHALAQRVQRICQTDTDAALGSIVLQQLGRVGTRRMLHSAILAETMLATMETPARQRHAVVCAALTMNLPILALQDELYRQSTPPTPAQREAIRQHPTQSAQQLLALGVTDPLWLALVRQHHEAPDGSGYPGGLTAAQLQPMAQVLALVDRYGAMATGRAYRPAMLPNVVLKDILRDRGKAVAPELASQLIRSVGIYPPGHLVQLADGDLCIVVRRTSNAAQPVVRCVQSRTGERLTTPRRRLTSEAASAVQGLLNLDRLAFQVDPATLWDETFALD